jgi:hypothetical protein
MGSDFLSSWLMTCLTIAFPMLCSFVVVLIKNYLGEISSVHRYNVSPTIVIHPGNSRVPFSPLPFTGSSILTTTPDDIVVISSRCLLLHQAWFLSPFQSKDGHSSLLRSG